MANSTGSSSRTSRGASYRSRPLEEARAWLEEYFSEENGRCERLPNPTGTREIWHLPSWAGYRAVHQEYLDSVAETGLAGSKPVSLSTFKRAWKRFFSWVKTPRVKRFAKCNDCARWKSILSGKVAPEQKAIAAADRAIHWARVTTERQFLGSAIHRSRINPDDILFFEIDGMDSSKTLLPHICQANKKVDPEKLIKYHLTCVKHNGTRPDEVYVYTNVLPHDASNTCTIIWMTLVKVCAFGYASRCYLVLVCMPRSETPGN